MVVGLPDCWSVKTHCRTTTIMSGAFSRQNHPLRVNKGVLLVWNHHVPGSSHVVGEVAIAAHGSLCDMQPPPNLVCRASRVYT